MSETEGFSTWFKETFQKEDCLNNTVFTRQFLIDAWNNGYNKANEWHNLNENHKDLPNEGEWVEGLYLWYYKGEPKWDVFKVRWYYEIGELDEKFVRWYGNDEYKSTPVGNKESGYKFKIPSCSRRINK